MRRIYVLVLMAASVIAVAPVQALDPCSLISRADMAAAMGQPVSSMTPSGPTRDIKSGGLYWDCQYVMGENMAVVSVVEFSTVGDVRKHFSVEHLTNETKDLGIKIVEEQGVGERAFMLIDTQDPGMHFLALKGARYCEVTVTGDGLASDRVKPTLRKLVVMLLGKL